MSPSTKIPRRPISLLPNALTLANAGLGLLAISKAIDALARSAEQAVFEQNLETACWLILAAGVFDILDGKVARLTNSFSDLGAQLDSLADAVTFGVAPAIVAKVLLEHEGLLHPRIHFICAAAFALMVVLRLARFNAEGDDEHSEFSGLPSPAAAGMLIATVLMFLSLGGAIESTGAQPTPPRSRCSWSAGSATSTSRRGSVACRAGERWSPSCSSCWASTSRPCCSSSASASGTWAGG